MVAVASHANAVKTLEARTDQVLALYSEMGELVDLLEVSVREGTSPPWVMQKATSLARQLNETATMLNNTVAAIKNKTAPV